MEDDSLKKSGSRRLAFWQPVTVALLFLGYAGYYFCRSNLSVALPLLVDDLAQNGMTPSEARVKIGSVISIGVLAYAAGKILLSGIADFWGGRVNFLGGMVGAILFTFLFALGGGIPVFTIAWVGNRFVQAGGWGGIVKVSARWFSYSAYGSVMGALSLSYLFGDAAGRQFMGMLIRSGVGWRGIFWASGGALLFLFVLNLIFLKESRTKIGAPEPEPNPINLFAGQGDQDKPAGLRDLLAPFLRSPLFGLVCVLSLGATLVRETFNVWTPTYLNQVIGYSKGDAASLSSLFPFFGGVSVLLAGFVSDRLGSSGRALVMTVGLSVSATALVGLAFLRAGSPSAFAVALVSIVAFGLLGPYSYLGGAMAMDFGGRKGGSLASGLIDGIGYLGGALSGDAVARISVAFGWPAVFQLLGGVALFSAAAAFVLLRLQRKAAQAAS